MKFHGGGMRLWTLSARIGFFTGPREPNGCRLWTGRVLRTGRVMIRHEGGMVNVTRWVAGLRPGDSRVAMHSCDVGHCVEPSHLRPGTQRENVIDMHSKNRHPSKTLDVCRNGHPLLEPSSRIIWSNGKRECAQCIKERRRRAAERMTPEARQRRNEASARWHQRQRDALRAALAVKP